MGKKKNPPRSSKSSTPRGEESADETKRPPQPVKLWIFVLGLILAMVGGWIKTTWKASEHNGNDKISAAAVVKPKRTHSLPVLDEWFPFQSLDQAWEQHPLLSTQQVVCSDDDNNCPTTMKKDTIQFRPNEIPTIDSQNTRVSISSQLQSLITQEQIFSQILVSPHLIPGMDFRVVKKILKDGEEWTGSLPDHMLTENVGEDAIINGGFSLIVNALHKQWTTVAQLARQLESELLPEHVTCNLYLTPPSPSAASNSGFESHWDWMDVLVVQIKGSKVWSVASQPQITYSTKDQKHKPTKDEMANYVKARYIEFTLHPGDVLYIPRGFIHNASSTTTTSLHLTFGIEHGCQSTLEALMHHAIELYDARGNRPSNLKVAIPASQCHGAGRDIPWKDVVHMVLAEAARRQEQCHPASSSSSSSSICVLRRSVPIATAVQEIGISSPQMLLQEGLKQLIQHANLTHTADFIQRLEMNQGESIRHFCHPYISPTTTVPCWDAVAQLSQQDLQSYLKELNNYAIPEFYTIQSWFQTHIFNQRNYYWNQENERLKKLGQSIPTING